MEMKLLKNIRILPIASDSMGVRSMACAIETPDLKILLDPGCTLGPHKEFKIPHPLEWQKNRFFTQNIINYAQQADLLFVSHFHQDHFKSPFPDYFYLHTDPEIANEIYRNKIIIHKSIDDLRHFQHERALKLQTLWKKVAKKIIKIENGNEPIYSQGSTLIFSMLEFHHSKPETHLGKIQPLRIQMDTEEIWFFSDVHGFIFPDDRKKILNELERNFGAYDKQNQSLTAVKNRILIFGGAPLHFLNKPKIMAELRSFYIALFQYFDGILCDHHPYRSSDISKWTNLMQNISLEIQRTNSHFQGVFSYFEWNQVYSGQNTQDNREIISEAFRLELFRNNSPTQEYLTWGQKCLEGQVEKRPPIDFC